MNFEDKYKNQRQLTLATRYLKTYSQTLIDAHSLFLFSGKVYNILLDAWLYTHTHKCILLPPSSQKTIDITPEILYTIEQQ